VLSGRVSRIQVWLVGGGWVLILASEEAKKENPSVFTFTGWSVSLRAVPIRIPNRNRNRLCTSHTQCVTFVTVTKCHNFEFVNSVTRSCFFWVFLAKQIWSHFGHKCHKWSQIQMWLVQTCFCFCFDWNGSEWTKYGKTYQKVCSISVSVWNPDRNTRRGTRKSSCCGAVSPSSFFLSFFGLEDPSQSLD